MNDTTVTDNSLIEKAIQQSDEAIVIAKHNLANIDSRATQLKSKRWGDDDYSKAIAAFLDTAQFFNRLLEDGPNPAALFHLAACCWALKAFTRQLLFAGISRNANVAAMTVLNGRLEREWPIRELSETKIGKADKESAFYAEVCEAERFALAEQAAIAGLNPATAVGERAANEYVESPQFIYGAPANEAGYIAFVSAINKIAADSNLEANDLLLMKFLEGMRDKTDRAAAEIAHTALNISVSKSRVNRLRLQYHEQLSTHRSKSASASAKKVLRVKANDVENLSIDGQRRTRSKY